MDVNLLRVLYVDDELSLLDIGKLYLEHFGSLRVDTASSALTALKKLSSGSYDAVISDYQMPEMDGIQFLQKVRSQYGDIPFILFTGRGREEIVIQAINHGADFYLQKGGDPKSQFTELEHKVRQAASRRQVEHALIQSERTSRALLDATTDAVVLITCDFSIVAVNEAFSQRFKVKPGEMIGKHIRNYVPAYLMKERDSYIAEVIASKKPVRFEDRMEDMFLENSVYPIYGDQGEVIRLAIYSRDISEKKQAETDLHEAYERIAEDEEELREKYDELARTEQQVRENEEQFRSLTESSLDTIMLFDHDLRQLYVNPNAEKQLGIPASTLIGKRLRDLEFPTHLKDLWEGTLKGVFNSGDTDRIEFQLPSGLWIDWLVVPIRGMQGDVERVITSARDITERKKYESDIEQRENLFRSIFENSLFGIVVTNSEFKFIQVNDAFCDLVGYTRDELVGIMGFPEVTYPDDIQASLDQMDRLIRHERNNFRIEKRYLSKSGRVIDAISFVQSIFDINGTYLGSAASILDITERKKTEHQIKLTEFSIEHSNVPTYWLDKDGQVIRANSAACEALGYSNEEITHLAIHDFDPVYSKEAWEQIWKRIQGQQHVVIESEHHKKNGTFFPVEISSSYFEYEGQQLIISFAYDITERKKAEEELKAAYEQIAASEETLKVNYQELLISEARFRGLFDQGFQLAGVLDLEGRLIQANKTALDFIGSSMDQVRNVPFWDSPWWDQTPQAQETLKNAIIRAKNGELVRFETTHLDKDNNIHYIDFTIKPIIDENGKTIALLPEGRDITSLKITEIELIKEQAFNKLLLDTSPVFLVAIGSDGKTLMMNQILLDTLEYSCAEVLGKDYLGTFVPESDQAMVSELFHKVISEGTVTLNENRIISRSGKEYLVEWHSRPVKGIGNEPDFFLGVGIDITNRKVAEESLRRSEERYRSLVETTGTGYVVLDLFGRVLDANGEYLRLTGKSAVDEILGKPVTEWTAPYDLDRNVDEVKKCVENGFVKGLEIDYIHPDGTIQPLEINASIFKSESGDVILTLCRDISNRKNKKT